MFLVQELSLIFFHYHQILFVQYTNHLQQGNHTDSSGPTEQIDSHHASQYFFHIEIEESEKLESMVYRLNGMLPDNIVVKRMWLMKDDAHARFSATKRSYQYFINPDKNPFNSAYEWNNSKFRLVNCYLFTYVF